MTTQNVQAAIAPGSTPYGERGKLEGAIAQSQATPQLPVAPGPISGQDPFGGPMSALMGEGGFSSGKPITSGLSVGPGGPPAPDMTGLPIDLMQRLQTIATQAKNPQLRGAAVVALRRIVKNRGR